MTDQDLNRVQTLQDKLLDALPVRRFIGRYGPNVPLWVGGPTANDLHDMILPGQESRIKQALADAMGEA